MIFCYKRNPEYNSYSSDCTNFVSQAIHSGGSMVVTPNKIQNGIYDTTSYWYSKRKKITNQLMHYDVATTWIRVIDFHSFWSKRKSVRTENKTGNIDYYGKVRYIIQFRRKSDSKWYHSTIITKKANSTVYLAGHTSDYHEKNITAIPSHLQYRLISF